MRISFAIAALLVLEIVAFIRLGGWLGAGAVILGVLVSSALGVTLIRRAGVGLQELRRPEELPAGLAVSAMRLLSGVLLVVPGPLTSAAGLLLLLAPVRSWLIRRLGGRLSGLSPGRPASGVVIEGEFTRVEPDGAPGDEGWRPGPRRPDSPWS